MAPFSTSERRKRRPGDRRSLEITMALKQTFESVIMTHLYPRSQIDIFVPVIQADGGASTTDVVVVVATAAGGGGGVDVATATTAGVVVLTSLLLGV